ncbi:MAG: hypothetical protein ACRBN8_20445 [Nannocystales bacterium]
MARTAAAVLMGLALAGCPANEDDEDTGDSIATSALYGGPTTDTATEGGSGTTSGTDSATSSSGSSGSSSTTAADTSGTSSSTGGETDTDGSTGSGSSTGISPDYGVPTTGE